MRPLIWNDQKFKRETPYVCFVPVYLAPTVCVHGVALGTEDCFYPPFTTRRRGSMIISRHRHAAAMRLICGELIFIDLSIMLSPHNRKRLTATIECDLDKSINFTAFVHYVLHLLNCILCLTSKFFSWRCQIWQRWTERLMCWRVTENWKICQLWRCTDFIAVRHQTLCRTAQGITWACLSCTFIGAQIFFNACSCSILC